MITNLITSVSLLIPQVTVKPKPDWPLAIYRGFWLKANWTSFRWEAGIRYVFANGEGGKVVRYAGVWTDSPIKAAEDLRRFVRHNQIFTQIGMTGSTADGTNFVSGGQSIWITVEPPLE